MLSTIHQQKQTINYMKRAINYIPTNVLSVLLIMALLFTTSCDDSTSDGPNNPTIEGEQTITEVTQINEAYTTLGEAIAAANLSDALNGEGPFTIFAPTDAAFEALGEETLASLSNEDLAKILQFHVVEGAITSGDLASTQDVTTLLGEEILVTTGGGVTVNNRAAVVAADFMASNGVIHAIDQVLLPKDFRDANIVDVAEDLGSFTTLAGALTNVGLETTFQFTGNYTVFAPTDDAFAALPEGLLAGLTTDQLTEVLSYHVLPDVIPSSAVTENINVETLNGNPVFIEIDSESNLLLNNGAEVVTADVEASNGIIHAINKVILPDTYGTIVDAASKRYELETLVNAVVTASLVDALSDSEASLTVFAPTEEAFAKLPAGLLESLTVEQLTEILQYHVVPTSVVSTDLASSQNVETLNGEEIYVTAEGGVSVNQSANVVTADIVTQNGIIHTIDEVLLPAGYRDANIIDKANELGIFTTLTDAVETAGLTSTLKYTGDYTVFAPTDDAFSKLPAGLLASLTTEQLTNILTYHVIGAEVFADDLTEKQQPASLFGEELFVTKTDGTVKVNNSATVVTADVDVSNGVVHAVDEVLLPNEFLNIVQIASKSYDLTTLVQLVSDQGLVPTLEGDGPFTLFAPVDTAFAAISETLAGLTSEQVAEVLTYHVVASKALSGDLSDEQVIETFQGENITVAIDDEGNVTLNGTVNVITVDLEGTNGVIHLIDGVLLPPSYQD